MDRIENTCNADHGEGKLCLPPLPTRQTDIRDMLVDQGCSMLAREYLEGECPTRVMEDEDIKDRKESGEDANLRGKEMDKEFEQRKNNRHLVGRVGIRKLKRCSMAIYFGFRGGGKEDQRRAKEVDFSAAIYDRDSADGSSLDGWSSCHYALSQEIKCSGTVKVKIKMHTKQESKNEEWKPLTPIDPNNPEWSTGKSLFALSEINSLLRLPSEESLPLIEFQASSLNSLLLATVTAKLVIKFPDIPSPTLAHSLKTIIKQVRASRSDTTRPAISIAQQHGNLPSKLRRALESLTYSSGTPSSSPAGGGRASLLQGPLEGDRLKVALLSLEYLLAADNPLLVLAEDNRSIRAVQRKCAEVLAGDTDRGISFYCGGKDLLRGLFSPHPTPGKIIVGARISDIETGYMEGMRKFKGGVLIVVPSTLLNIDTCRVLSVLVQSAHRTIFVRPSPSLMILDEHYTSLQSSRIALCMFPDMDRMEASPARTTLQIFLLTLMAVNILACGSSNQREIVRSSPIRPSNHEVKTPSIRKSNSAELLEKTTLPTLKRTGVASQVVHKRLKSTKKKNINARIVQKKMRIHCNKTVLASESTSSFKKADSELHSIMSGQKLSTNRLTRRRDNKNLGAIGITRSSLRRHSTSKKFSKKPDSRKKYSVSKKHKSVQTDEYLLEDEFTLRISSLRRSLTNIGNSSLDMRGPRTGQEAETMLKEITENEYLLHAHK